MVSAAFSADECQSFSNPFPVRSVIAYDNGILLATDGGIRYRTIDGDFIHHSENGLETSSYYALAASKVGTFAASEYGLIASINHDGRSWRVLNRSYVSNSSKVRPDAMIIADSVLTIAFDDRLAFFDVAREKSILTINKIRDKNLSVDHIDKIAAHGDSLFVLMGDSAYVRVIDWKNINKDVKLSSPVSWSSVDGNNVAEFMRDKLKNLLGHNSLLQDAERNSNFPLNDSTGASLVKWSVKGRYGYYLVTEDAIIHYDGRSFRDLSMQEDGNNFQLDDTYEIAALSMGGVIAASTDGGISYGSAPGWSNPQYPMSGIGSGLTAASSRLKTLSSTADGHVFFHIWGLGYYQYSDWSINLRYDHLINEDLCIDNYLKGDEHGAVYRISIASTPAPDSSGFLSTSGSSDGHYSLLYFTNSGEVYCANQVGSGMLGGPMSARIDEDGSWVIYVGARNGTIAASEGDLDVLRCPSPKANGGELSNCTRESYKGLSSSLVDMVYDSTEKRLWGVSISEVAYLDDGDTVLNKPSSIRGMQGAELSSLDMDVRGNLWVGSLNQGAFRLSKVGKSPDSLVAMSFNSRKGLLSDEVSDLAVDPVLGAVWFSHTKGVTRYYRNDLKDAGKNMTDSATADVKAYPIPFRPKIHRVFNIVNIAENTLVSIFNRGGALVRSFRNEEVLGGKVEWNGKDREGNLVAPGVYYYVVKNSSKVKKGKFIIIH